MKPPKMLTLAPVAALLFSACAPAPPTELSEIPTGHPANPHAASAPLPPAPHLREDAITRATEEQLRGEPPPPSGTSAPMTMPMNMPMQGHAMEQPTTEAEAGATYTCVMHPEIHSDAPGKCPKCGMKLIKETKHTHE